MSLVDLVEGLYMQIVTGDGIFVEFLNLIFLVGISIVVRNT